MHWRIQDLTLGGRRGLCQRGGVVLEIIESVEGKSKSHYKSLFSVFWSHFY